MELEFIGYNTISYNDNIMSKWMTSSSVYYKKNFFHDNIDWNGLEKGNVNVGSMRNMFREEIY